ncbi:MAG: cytochrome c oxidase subunit II [Pseudomonadota bacterium]
MKAVAAILSGLTGTLSAGAAFAAQPKDWGIWHQEAGSDMMAAIEWFDLYTFWFITPITVFVMLLLLWVMIRYNAKANPTPSKTSHNTFIEVVWTVAPIVILIGIAVPSFELLDSQFDPGEEPTLTIKATGQTWYWDYEYQNENEVAFSSNMLSDSDLESAGKKGNPEFPRLLAVDNEVIVPVGETVRVLVTADAAGVIHNFAMPAFGLKMDAIPGRINETWFKANKEGVYYGQCSELCGINHAFMPIAIRVVARAEYEAWESAAVDDLEGANKTLMATLEKKKKNLKLAESQSAD